MKADGYSCRKIAKILNDKNIATPGEYLLTKTIKHSSKYKKFWTYIIILRIIKNEIYIGKNVRNKFYSDFKGKRYTVPYDKRIIRNTQPAIVSEDIYNKAVASIKQHVVHNINLEKPVNIFNKKIKCNGCGHFLTKKDNKYFCNYSNISNLKCYKGKLDKNFLSSLIIDNINTMSNIAQNIKNMRV